jgi:hypothetical protein
MQKFVTKYRARPGINGWMRQDEEEELFDG